MLVAAAVALIIAAPTATVAPAQAKAKLLTRLAPAIQLFHLTTHERYHLRPGPRGAFGKRELRGWSRFLRCHHTQRVHFMSPRLADLIYKVSRHFEGKRVLVVAGFRAPRVAREKGNTRSPHKLGTACDFRVEGVATTEVRDYVRGFNRVGVGFYPNSDFVHLDVRNANAFWVDYSGPGERSRYSQDPESDLAAEKLKPLPNPNDPTSEIGGADPQKPIEPGASAPKPPPEAQVKPQED